MPMADMAGAAQRAGLKEICFTEHIDIDFPGDIDFVPDLDYYADEFEKVKATFLGMNVRKGIEAGLELRTKRELELFTAGKEFDYVIGSVHLIGGLDPYGSEFWHLYRGRRAFEEYLSTCIECAQEFDLYDVFGHLGYPAKFCPHDGALLRYEDHKDALDTLLGVLVKKGKGLEVNTSAFVKTGSVMPEEAVIKRYLELGGEIVTVGSDAHDEQSVGRAVPETLSMLKSIGLKYICAYDKRKPRFIAIP